MCEGLVPRLDITVSEPDLHCVVPRLDITVKHCCSYIPKFCWYNRASYFLYRAAAAIECDGLWTLMRSFASSQPPYSSLPPSTQRTLMEALLLYGMGDRGHQYLTEVSAHLHLWNPCWQSPSSLLSLQLLHPFQHRFTSLIQRPDFRTKFQDVELQQELLVILEALCGVALCGLTQVVWLAMAPEYFHYLLPLLQACVPLLELFADISEVVRVIFDLFCLVTEGYLCILDEVSIVNVISCDVIHFLKFTKG